MEDFVIDKASWHTKRIRNYHFDNIVVYKYFKHGIKFMQDNGLTTRIILDSNDVVTDETCIRKSDLTDEGLSFIKKVYDKWTDKVVDKKILPIDFKMLDRALKEIRAKNNS